MKKILVINKSFETGGIQSSMINMINELAEYCQVDLFLYNPEGPMKERLSAKVQILPTSWRFRALGMGVGSALKSGDIRVALYRLFAAVWCKLFDNRLPINSAIRHYGRLTGYDVAIAFHQEQRRKTVVSGFARVADRLSDAKKKIAWLHFDSNTIDLDKAFNLPFYEKMDRLYCVSRSLMEAYQKNNPALAHKVDYCYNFMEYDKMLQKSREKQEVSFPEGKFICFSACRLAPEKALVRGVKALAPVFREHPEVMWFIAGDGAEREGIEKAVMEEKLEGQIVLLGNQKNPYPYMKHADLLMNLSYHEAAPMVFFEARVFGVPVFATQTSSALELLEGISGMVCPNTEAGITQGFRKLLAQGVEKMPGFSADNADSRNKILSYFEDAK